VLGVIRFARRRVRRLLQSMGIEISRRTVHTSADLQLSRLLKYCDVDLVLDVGANAGQYASELRRHGYCGRIVSFEPLSTAHDLLRLAASRHRGWEVAPRAALGEADGEVVIHVAGNSASSSILDMLPAHERASPESGYVSTESAPLRRLDAAAAQFLGESRRALLKIDTQGYEDRVLAGAAGIMDRIVAVQTELSLVPLYSNQLLFEEMLHRLEALGFVLYAIHPNFVDERSGRTLQVDGYFVRSELAESA
jgi:FkbM family methyltransferase